MIQIQYRIAIDENHEMTVEADMLNREDANESERLVAQWIETQIQALLLEFSGRCGGVAESERIQPTTTPQDSAHGVAIKNAVASKCGTVKRVTSDCGNK